MVYSSKCQLAACLPDPACKSQMSGSHTPSDSMHLSQCEVKCLQLCIILTSYHTTVRPLALSLGSAYMPRALYDLDSASKCHSLARQQPVAKYIASIHSGDGVDFTLRIMTLLKWQLLKIMHNAGNAEEDSAVDRTMSPFVRFRGLWKVNLRSFRFI